MSGLWQSVPDHGRIDWLAASAAVVCWCSSCDSEARVVGHAFSQCTSSATGQSREHGNDVCCCNNRTALDSPAGSRRGLRAADNAAAKTSRTPAESTARGANPTSPSPSAKRSRSTAEAAGDLFSNCKSRHSESRQVRSLYRGRGDRHCSATRSGWAVAVVGSRRRKGQRFERR